MLKKFRKELPVSIFEDISNINNGYWNEEKTSFTPYFNLNNNKYSVLDRYSSNTIDYVNPGFYSRLLCLKDLGVINNIDSREFVLINDKVLYEHHIDYDINKLNLLKELIHGINYKDLKVSKKLINLILFLNLRYTNRDFNPFDLDVIKEELSIDDDKYIFNDFETFIYSISNYNGALIKKLVDYLVEYVDDEDKSLLVRTLEKDEIIDGKIFWYQKINKELFIYHHSGERFKIKTIEYDSYYDALSESLMSSIDGIITREYISKEYHISIPNLPDIKKQLNFSKVLNKLFFNKSISDKLSFNKVIYQETLKEKNMTEQEILDYLKSNFK